jgi:hypothetical protein
MAIQFAGPSLSLPLSSPESAPSTGSTSLNKVQSYFLAERSMRKMLCPCTTSIRLSANDKLVYAPAIAADLEFQLGEEYSCLDWSTSTGTRLCGWHTKALMVLWKASFKHSIIRARLSSTGRRSIRQWNLAKRTKTFGPTVRSSFIHMFNSWRELGPSFAIAGSMYGLSLQGKLSVVRRFVIWVTGLF